jgi:biopolymer transport protein ExbB
MIRIFLTLILLVAALPAQAWWNDEWTARKAITLNTATDGADLKAGLDNVPVLIRLHTGNFDFMAARTDGADLRFVSEDDKLPLKFHIEKFDPVTEVALVWVQTPKLQPGNKTQKIWLYYGNEEVAAAGGDAKATYDVTQTGVWHFAEANGAPQDATAYANHGREFNGARFAGAAIGEGVKFDGESALSIPASPSMKIGRAAGFSVSAWVRVETAGQNAVLFSQQEGAKSIVLALEGGKLVAVVNDGSVTLRSEPTVDLPLAVWHHVALTVEEGALLYVNGQKVAESPAICPDMTGDITLGRGFVGEVDELNLANVARSADWFRAASMGQGLEAKLAVFGEEEGEEGGGEASYFGVILQNVTLDGWVVIVILMIMLAISTLVMTTKALVVNKTDKANKGFMEAFRNLDSAHTADLDQADDKEDADLKDSGLASIMFGHHDHHQNASLYRIYHAGINEVKKRVGERTDVMLSPQALNAIRATLDGTLVRENQKLNSLMVLLTIAISGGPFLGLLGTVVGVMITFAAIAATGDVNVAAIAPGIAAALVATAAGVGVAIPSLFGYNYLGSRIKSISADMHVFVDEYIAKIAETYSR